MPSCFSASRSLFVMYTEGAAYNDGEIWLFINGARKTRAVPKLQGAEAKLVQSPAIIAGVGTVEMLLPGFSRRIESWNPAK